MLAGMMDRILNANLSIDGVWPLPSPRAAEGLVEVLGLEDELPEELRQFTQGWDEDQIEELLDGNTDAWEHLIQNMIAAGWCGYLIQASTPVREKFGRHVSFSWAYTHGNMLIATDLAKGLEMACEWAELMATKEAE